MCGSTCTTYACCSGTFLLLLLFVVAIRPCRLCTWDSFHGLALLSAVYSVSLRVHFIVLKQSVDICAHCLHISFFCP